MKVGVELVVFTGPIAERRRGLVVRIETWQQRLWLPSGVCVQEVVEGILPHAIESVSVADTPRWANALRAEIGAVVGDGRVPVKLEADLPAHRARIVRELAVQRLRRDTDRFLYQLAASRQAGRNHVLGGLSRIDGSDVEMDVDPR